MDDYRTELICVLDSSGSMARMASDMIGGLNNLLQEQREQPGQLLVSLTTFDTDIRHPFSRLPLELVGGLSAHVDGEDPNDGLIYHAYIPKGGTALLDALGSTIDRTGDRLSSTPEEQRPDKVIVVVLTDGQENSSREYDLRTVRQKVEHQQEQYDWSFIFLGVGIDAFGEGGNLGISQQYTRGFAHQPEGLRESYGYASQSVSELRQPNYESGG
ncbi:MAG TPA: vWA domain-containing protein [Gammaproteobacteria bacterium]|nr:vWA domain-containing protein [Gammaproteobacteria bacterium]